MVSIILPVYNSEKYLNKCLSSILNQSYSNWELIIVNDGSTDSSFDIINQFESKDNRIKCVNVKNGGVAIARNIGIEKAKGEYLTFVDSDDYLDSNYLFMLLEGLEKHSCDASCCNYTEVIKSQSTIMKSFDTIHSSSYTDSFKVAEDIIYHKIKCGFCWGKLFKREIIKHSFKNYNYCEDVLFLIENFLEKQYKIFIVDKPLYYYNRQLNSVTMQKKADKISDMLNVSIYLMQKYENESVYRKGSEALTIDYSFYILLNVENNTEYIDLLRECRNNIRNYRFKVLLDPKSTVDTKIACFMSIFPEVFLKKLYKIRNNE